MKILPQWFQDFSEKTVNIKTNFPQKLGERADDLIIVFGAINHDNMQFVSEIDRKIYLKKLSNITKIKTNCVDALVQNTSFNYLKIKQEHLFDDVSASSPNSTKDCVVDGMLQYFLACPMPLQESISLNCFRFTKIQQALVVYNAALLKAVHLFYNWADSNKGQEHSLEDKPTLEALMLLSKHAATRGFKESTSFLTLIHVWARQGTKDNWVLSWEDKHNPFFKLLIKDKKLVDEDQEEKICSFQDFVIEDTIDLLFFHEDSLLPKIDKELIQTISNVFKGKDGEIGRLSAIEFINQLHIIFEKKEEADLVKKFDSPRLGESLRKESSPRIDLVNSPRNKESPRIEVFDSPRNKSPRQELSPRNPESPRIEVFDSPRNKSPRQELSPRVNEPQLFKKGMGLLQQYSDILIYDAYDLLHTAVHYFNFLEVAEVPNSEKLFLFKAIYSLGRKERSNFDSPHIEKSKRMALKLNAHFIEFKKNHPLTLEEWGKIFLRVSTCFPYSQKGNSFFLSWEESFKFIKEVESHIGTLLPHEICEKLIHMQGIKKEALDLVLKHRECKALIIESYLSTLSVPEEIYRSLQAWTSTFMGFFDIDLINKYLKDSCSFLTQLNNISSFLEFATYPLFLIKLANQIPTVDSDGKLNLNEKAQHGVLRPLTEFLIPLNPIRWVTRWVYNNESGLYEFDVNVCNIEKMFNVSFRVPLSIPVNPQFLQVLKTSVDSLGIEKIEKFELKSKSLPQLSNSATHSKVSPREKEDDKNNSILTGDTKEEKKEKEALIEFVSALRIKLLRSIFAVMIDDDKGFAYYENLNFFSIHENCIIIQGQRPIIIDKKYYEPLFENLYHEELWMGKFVTQEKMEVEVTVQRTKNGAVISMHAPEKKITLETECPSLGDQKTFTNFLFWHLVLFLEEYQKLTYDRKSGYGSSFGSHDMLVQGYPSSTSSEDNYFV